MTNSTTGSKVVVVTMVSIYHAATGRRPFQKDDMLELLIAHRNEIPARPGALRRRYRAPLRRRTRPWR